MEKKFTVNHRYPYCLCCTIIFSFTIILIQLKQKLIFLNSVYTSKRGIHMKKSIYQIGAVVMLSAFLAACNTDTDEPTATNAAKEEPTETEQVQNEEQQETNETNETSESDETSSEQNEEAAEPSEETKAEQEDKGDTTTALTYISNGQTF